MCDWMLHIFPTFEDAFVVLASALSRVSLLYMPYIFNVKNFIRLVYCFLLLGILPVYF